MRYLILFIIPFMSLTAYTTTELSASPKVVLLEKFLSEAECNYLIQGAVPQLMRSRVFTAKGEQLDHRRTSKGMFYPSLSSDPVLTAVENRVARLVELPRENGEGIQVLWYQEGGEYQPHFDYFDPKIPGGVDRGGQRVVTVIMYLNNVEEGGETIFPKLDIAVSPVKGNALLFYNCTPDGREDPRTLHGGAPVKKGEKWIANKWIRLERFH